MISRITTLYEKVVLHRPLLTLLAVGLIVAFFSLFVQHFKLDASGDSLVLENDKDLRYYRSIQARYGSDDYVIITYTPKNDLFSKESLSKSPPISLTGMSDEVRRLEDPDTDISLAKKELLTSPLYKDLIISPDGNTTALQVIFRRDDTFYSLLERRDGLREKELVTELMQDEEDELVKVSRKFKDYTADLMDRESRDIARIRAIMDKYRDNAELYLGGVPMIASDMTDFIRHDLRFFGLGVLCFLIVMLEIFFHKARWVVISMLCCFASVLLMFGYIGFFQWRVTVVS
jgi:predicted RND superfamily exporter protein